MILSQARTVSIPKLYDRTTYVTNYSFISIITIARQKRHWPPYRSYLMTFPAFSKSSTLLRHRFAVRGSVEYLVLVNHVERNSQSSYTPDGLTWKWYYTTHTRKLQLRDMETELFKGHQHLTWLYHRINMQYNGERKNLSHRKYWTNIYATTHGYNDYSIVYVVGWSSGAVFWIPRKLN